MPDLMTRWGRELDVDHVLAEHPRPQLVRDSHLNLNGRWEHAFTAEDAPAPSTYDGPIVVPFSPEAPLSGVGRQLQPDERLWYRRTVTLPDGFVRDRVLLHFGAVDQTCTVWLNDVEVGGNEGGYWAFTLDVTEALRPGENTLVVAVRDLSDGHQHASGKQRLQRGNIWYTAQSGIWQTVWMESVPATWVDRLTLTPHLADGELEITVHAAGTTAADGGPATARVEVAGREVEVAVGEPTRIGIDDVRPWSPEDPHLYDVAVTLGADHVTSYAGMRSVGITTDADGTPRITLNGEPYLHLGVLDQGYWPDGLMTAPSDAALVHDVETMKRLGFTMLRKHIKVESMRFYHHCDRLGMLVWQDAVNGGAPYRRRAVANAKPRHFDDTVRRRPLGREDAAGRALFERELARTIDQLHDVVSIVVWVPFNEGWGQFDAARIAEETATRDPSRLVDHASGWHDQGAGDLWSLHVYQQEVAVPSRPSAERRAFVLSEYGGVSLLVPGHAFDETRTFGHGTSRTEEAWLESFTRLHDDQIATAVRQGLAATVYTQLSDVEDEVNGLLTYDRETSKAPEAAVRAAVDAVRAAYDDARG
ncbi:glycoside hydrolase family 2 [Nocardioides sp. HDW12B]|uniref:glycoside hydrolase family 2 protein n=1 Tax=Nocardioides sp. HDW12B TaxID=2714939 RepID=UPI00140DB3A0|nr:sugar-binding domain-containing protein [Nocardioides sp. HDW12B]QIK65397.1 glycoside hydrolase family 2 [Nocardioides sp. HDW12B]